MKLLYSKVVDIRIALQQHFSVCAGDRVYVDRIMAEAGKVFGFWREGYIDSSEIGGIVLPYHVEEGVEVIGASGETLEHVYKRLFLSDGGKEYSKKSPKCFKKVMGLKDVLAVGDGNSFIFTEGPFVELDGSYEKMTMDGRVTHLDGLHRLIALMDLPNVERPPLLKSYIAYRSENVDGE